ncbi:MAG: adenylate/guanylate cyclase domain-containing protein [Magnetococcales bacterium]|nr:adenylate/guanylate cyclase domain-containing protein [Magnetococcales bacterium]
MTKNLEKALQAQRKAYAELKETKIQLAETHAVAVMTKVFEKFVPKQFLARIAPHGLEHIVSGTVSSRPIAILFSDLRSFTTFSEKMTPGEIFSFLNEYLAQMLDPIELNDGFVDKFIGDAIMALFDQDGVAQAEAAVKAAIGMQKQLVAWNATRTCLPHMDVASGVGIHIGEVMLGTLGSSTRMNSTVIGDAVNLASRLEGLTKYYGVRIIVSGEFLACLDKDSYGCRELDLVSVKGRTAPVTVYEVYHDLEGNAWDRHRNMAEVFGEALALYRKRLWNEAREQFQACIKLAGSDTASSLFINRCNHYGNTPPPDDWDGTHVMESK